MELTHCINYLLTTAQRRIFQELSTRLEPYDVTPVQYGVLYCLWETDIHTPREIADKLQLENSTISGVLDRMEKKELIERQVSRKDRRYIEVVLTEKGEKLKNDVLATVEQFNEDVMSAFSKENQNILSESLSKLSEYQGFSV